ncbi:MAG: methyltransferase domain-containing protein [Proteobacteria bacterium]|nr:methyltransferase domain-containing protein [Pseudomonadota bacterium]
MTARAHKSRVALSFAAASPGYEDAAGFQRLVAGRLAGKIACSALPPRPRVLEIGCGTGFLTRSLSERLPGARWLVTDISWPMVARCRESPSAPPGTAFAVMDGERPAVRGPFDLICASLVLPWFEDPAGAVRALGRRLGPGGLLAFSTLSEGTFREWLDAYRTFGLSAASPAFPRARELAQWWRGMGAVETLEEEETALAYSSAHAFASHLKTIGAQTPAPGSPPLPNVNLLKVLRRLRDPVTITYRVAYGLFRKESPCPHQPAPSNGPAASS